MVARDTKYLKEEWCVRNQVMDACLEALSDGQPHTCRQLVDQLGRQGFKAPKQLVNSVLFGEARRYVLYDRQTFTYRLRESECDLEDSSVTSLTVTAKSRHTSNHIKARSVGRNDEYVFRASKLTSPAFFETSAKGRTIEVVLNENHPLFSRLDSLINPVSDTDCSATYERLVQAQQSLELLLVAWSKYENEQPDGPRKFKAEEARLEWGRNARESLLDDMEGNE